MSMRTYEHLHSTDDLVSVSLQTRTVTMRQHSSSLETLMIVELLQLYLDFFGRGYHLGNGSYLML
jgi:hypothetical protein